MRNLISTLIVLITFFQVSAQVGINTTNPQQEVHLAGSTENVRIDGLNDTNNVNNYGVDQTTRVFADADGDLILGSMGDDFEILVDTDNYLENVENPTSIIIQTGTGLGYNPAGIPVDHLNASFTLTAKAIVEVNYSVSWSVYHVQHHKKKRIEDQRSKIIQTGLFFRENDIDGDAVIYDGNGDIINEVNGGSWCIDTTPTGDNCLEEGGLIALNGQFYNNSLPEEGSYQCIKNTASDYVILGPGTYIAMFAARMQVGDTGGTGESRIYLGICMDELQIMAYYYAE